MPKPHKKFFIRNLERKYYEIENMNSEDKSLLHLKFSMIEFSKKL